MMRRDASGVGAARIGRMPRPVELERLLLLLPMMMVSVLRNGAARATVVHQRQFRQSVLEGPDVCRTRRSAVGRPTNAARMSVRHGGTHLQSIISVLDQIFR